MAAAAETTASISAAIAEVIRRVGLESQLSDLLTATAIVVAAFGWVASYWLNRRLQRRQLAVNLINDHRFSHLWTHSSRMVMDIARTQNDYDWKTLVQNHRTRQSDNTDPKTAPRSERDLYYCLFRVLNYFEFLSNAMLGRVVAEPIIKRQLRTNFITLYRSTKPLIEWLRNQPYGSQTLFEQFEEICNNWGEAKKPGRVARVWRWFRDQ